MRLKFGKIGRRWFEMLRKRMLAVQRMMMLEKKESCFH